MGVYLCRTIDPSHQALQHGIRSKLVEGCITAACDLSALECADHVGAGLTPSYRGDDLFHQQLSEACGIVSVVPKTGDIAPNIYRKWLQFHVFQGASHAFGGRGHQRAVKRSGDRQLGGA